MPSEYSVPLTGSGSDPEQSPRERLQPQQTTARSHQQANSRQERRQEKKKESSENEKKTKKDKKTDEKKDEKKDKKREEKKDKKVTEKTPRTQQSAVAEIVAASSAVVISCLHHAWTRDIMLIN